VSIAPSSSPQMALRSLQQVRAENRVLVHFVWWAAAGLCLLAINLVTSGFENPWWRWPVLVWAPVLVAHALVLAYLRRRCAVDLDKLSQQPGGSTAGGAAVHDREVEGLRQRLLRSAEEARAALRPVSPEAAGEVSRGEAHALKLVAWLEEAEPFLERGETARRLRHQVASALSRPGRLAARAKLERLLGQLDLQDVRFATLRREVGRRRSLLESFLLVIDSASVAGATDGVLAAVREPIRERVELLEEAVSARAAGAGGLQDQAPGAESERIHEEVRLARDLQRSILPREAPQVPGLQVALFYQPCSEVGGDFYDFYAVGPETLLVAVGDASGHGLDSSMVTSMAKSALYTQVSAGRELAETMAELNRLMCDTLGRRRLMTLALLQIEAQRRVLSWVNAGQVFPLLRRRGQVQELERSSYPLGVRREVAYPVLQQNLEPGDVLLLITDGFVEAVNATGHLYGWDRLVDRLRLWESSDASHLIDELLKDLERHMDGAQAQDDLTLIAIRVGP
jgi:serine phosphatase RsbU (regulator of sigma subunit)